MSEQANTTGTTTTARAVVDVFDEEAREVWEACGTALALLPECGIHPMYLDIVKHALDVASRYTSPFVLNRYEWPDDPEEPEVGQ
jgi:hypothetical protein